MITLTIYSINGKSMYQGYVKVPNLPSPNQTIRLGNKSYLVRKAQLTAKNFGFAYVY